MDQRRREYQVPIISALGAQHASDNEGGIARSGERIEFRRVNEARRKREWMIGGKHVMALWSQEHRRLEQLGEFTKLLIGTGRGHTLACDDKNSACAGQNADGVVDRAHWGACSVRRLRSCNRGGGVLQQKVVRYFDIGTTWAL